MHTLITEIRDKQNITKEQLQLLLETDNREMIEELMACARTEAQKVYGNKVYMRGLIEFTNYCKNNCYYLHCDVGDILSFDGNLDEEEEA